LFEVFCVAADSARIDGLARDPVAASASKEDISPEADGAEAEPLDGQEAARRAGLRWVSDTAPGISRKKQNGKFHFIGKDGAPIADPATRGRLESLVIPPAWEGVWITPVPNGHIQATGRDARGRKQYIYHPKWLAARDSTKYHRMRDFGRRLPALRKAVRKDLRRHGLGRERVAAAVVYLLDLTAIRIGNEQYARENKSFGLTTLRNRHVKVHGERVRFTFVGKGGKKHDLELSDRRMAKVLARCAATPGQRLFQFFDDKHQQHALHSADVNDYLRGLTHRSFTAKDFRTWTGSVLAARHLAELEPPKTKTEGKRQLTAMLGEVSGALGNTPAVCRKCYIHPAVIEGYLDGSLSKAWRKNAGQWQRAGRDPYELLLLRMLENQTRSSNASDTRSKAKRRKH
jgi:DNA topoisomerase I